MSEEAPIRPDRASVQRNASVLLRTPGASDAVQATPLDPANQSLADALRLVYRGVQAGMVMLLLFFAFSGFQQVREGQSGVRLLFGRVVADDLRPGPQFSFPYPFGELITVNTGVERLDLDDSFWPRLTEEQRRQSIERVAQMGRHSLKPGEDGSNLTGDGSVAHTRWSVQYRRRHPAQFLRSIYREHERDIVRAAVERGVVQAVAQIGIDDLLRQSPGDEGSVAGRVRQIAQQMLDDIGSGIEIRQVSLQEKIPPLPVYSAFNEVQAAAQRASNRRDAAEAEARNRLHTTAGAAADVLVRLIDQYELALARGDVAEQAALQSAIEGLFEGRPVSVDGQTVEMAPAGTVAAVIHEARRYRSGIVNQRRAELDAFEGKLKQFLTNPDFVIQREWAEAMTRVLTRPVTEVFTLPPGATRVQIVLNPDPVARREQEKERKLAEYRRSEEQRRLEQEREALKVRTPTEMSTDLTVR